MQFVTKQYSVFSNCSSTVTVSPSASEWVGGEFTVQARYVGDLVDVAVCGNRSMRIQDSKD